LLLLVGSHWWWEEFPEVWSIPPVMMWRVAMARHASWQVPAVRFLGNLALVFLFPDISATAFFWQHLSRVPTAECHKSRKNISTF